MCARSNKSLTHQERAEVETARAVLAHAPDGTVGEARALLEARSLLQILDAHFPVDSRRSIEMSYDQREAILWFAWEHGRRWKEALRDEWMRACARLPARVAGFEYRSSLQQLRNDPRFGTSGLAKFRLPRDFKFDTRGRRG